ncbi:MAG: sugar phosphate isomerase/epimerase [Planctomycetes bacterium]|nr:sugar phosphate isomerase/epimerase [Planctomycetota bacterium]
MPDLLLGYNTNGFAHHRLEDALEIVAELGYRAVAITLDVHHLDPFRAGLGDRVEAVRARLERLGLVPVVETGARYILDPRAKHEPTLVSLDAAGRERRLDYLFRSVDLASELGAGVVSFWSGRLAPSAGPEQARDHLVDGCRRLADRAEEKGVDLAFEPEPGMMIERASDYPELAAAVGSPRFRLTLDVGHLLLTGEPMAATIRRFRDSLANVHIEDMKRPVHEHLMFGEGEVPFPEALGALVEIGFRGPVTVELSRHSHAAPEAAARAKRFLDATLRAL